MNKAPASRRLLDIAIDRLAMRESLDPVRLRRFIGNVIVAQLLPAGVVKGGSSLKLRFGNLTTRYTKDLDAARALGQTEYVDALEERLLAGWGGFTGHALARKPARVKGVEPQYVMKPYDIKLDYNGKPWLTVPLEVGHDEIGDADEPERALSKDVPPLFEALGLPVPDAVFLMPLHFQVAQKLHAVSTPNTDRARDLIDLQLIIGNAELDLAKTEATCRRLFAYRKQQPWPPTIAKGRNWDDLYRSAKEDLAVLATADEAVAWANELIATVAVANQRSD